MTLTVDTDLTRAEAERLATRIDLRLGVIADNYAAVMPLIREAITRNAYVALGYNSHSSFISDRFGDTLSKLAVEIRREVSRELSAAGMSTRAIAPVVGISREQVRRDTAPDTNVSPDVPQQMVAADTSEVDPPADPLTGEIIEAGDTASAEVVAPPRTVTGLDGKTYSASSPRPVQRKALTDTAKDAGWELRKAVERLQRIAEDDRFSRNKEEVAAHIRGHLMFTVEVCQDLLDILNQPQKG